jgi:hypothetical protein
MRLAWLADIGNKITREGVFAHTARGGASEIFPSRRGQNQLIRRQLTWRLAGCLRHLRRGCGGLWLRGLRCGRVVFGNGTSELSVLKLYFLEPLDPLSPQPAVLDTPAKMRLLRDHERLHHLGERFAVSGHNLDLTKLSHDLFRPAPLRCNFP